MFSDTIKEKWYVDLLKFILYLYIQHANVISLKSPICTGDEYPSRNRSQELEGRAAIGTKVIWLPLDETPENTPVANAFSIEVSSAIFCVPFLYSQLHSRRTFW